MHTSGKWTYTFQKQSGQQYKSVRSLGAGREAAVKNEKHPAKLVTVFAGMETDAVNTARNYMLPYPPSSPAMALFKDGKLVHMIERHMIEGRPAQMIADNLVAAFDEYC